jgi:hypothetical protein
VRLTITETPRFEESKARGERVRIPTLTVLRRHTKMLVAGTLLSLATFTLFYLMIVFALSWGTTALGYGREKFLLMQLFDTLFFAVMIPVSAILAERGRRNAMLGITGAIFLFGLILAPMFEAGTGGALGMMALGLALMGMTGRWFQSCFRRRCAIRGARWRSTLRGFWGRALRRILRRGWRRIGACSGWGTTCARRRC